MYGKITQLWMTSCQISLAATCLFLAFVFLKQEIWSEGRYYKKKVQMRSSVERRKLQRCMACYVKSRINLLRRLLRKRAGLRNLNAMFVWEKLKTICWLSNWIQRSIQKNAGIAERRAELRRSTRRLQSIIQVSSWRLYNVYNTARKSLQTKNRLQQSGRW